jgi:hypothetical protein
MKLQELAQTRAVLERFLYSDTLRGEVLEMLMEIFGRSAGSGSLGATKTVEMKENRRLPHSFRRLHDSQPRFCLTASSI